MRQAPGDIASQLQELASRSLRQHVRNNQRFADLLKRISGGELSMQEVRDGLRQFSERETAEYVRTLTTMGINFFSSLLELNQSHNERFFQRLGDAHGSERTAPKIHGQLVLRGNLGETVQGRFVIENRREQVSDVAMTISPVSGRDGVAFQAPFVIEPASFRLGNGEERAVLLSVRLHPELFKPGEQYFCQLRVHGPEPMLLEVRIQVAEEPVKTESVAAVVSVEVEEELPGKKKESEPPPAGKKRQAARAAGPARRKRTGKKTATKRSSSVRKRAPKQNP